MILVAYRHNLSKRQANGGDESIRDGEARWGVKGSRTLRDGWRRRVEQNEYFLGRKAL